LILGIWEVGQMVHLQQILSNSVREGARQASSGRFTASANYATDTSGNTLPTPFTPVTGGTDYEVQRTVLAYLQDASFRLTPNATVTVTNLTQGWTCTAKFAGAGPPIAITTVGAPPFDPAMAANQFNDIQVTLTNVDYDPIRWSPFHAVFAAGQKMRAQATWKSTHDKPIVPDQTIPTSPN